MYLNHEVAFLDTLLCRSLLSLTDACWDTCWLIDLSKEQMAARLRCDYYRNTPQQNWRRG